MENNFQSSVKNLRNMKLNLRNKFKNLRIKKLNLEMMKKQKLKNDQWEMIKKTMMMKSLKKKKYKK